MKYFSKVGEAEIKLAAKNLKLGNLVVFPTETVYGLGADAENEKALINVYKVKNRPLKDPLIVHIKSLDKLEYWADEIPEYVYSLVNNFWPGPLTLILKKNSKINNIVSGGSEMIAIRCPDNSIAIQLLSQFEKLGGNGIAAPSANMFSQVSPTDSNAVIDELGNRLGLNDFILDGGNCPIGIESTILQCATNGTRVVRPGKITESEISFFIRNLSSNLGSNELVPGSFRKHYSPRTKIKIVLPEEVPNGKWVLALECCKFNSNIKRLDTPKSLEEFAHSLYRNLRKADKIGLDTLYVVAPDASGIGIAITDRLRKAMGR